MKVISVNAALVLAALLLALGYLLGAGLSRPVQLALSLALYGLVWTPPKNWTSIVVTVNDLNTHIRDNMLVLKTSMDDNGRLVDPVVVFKTATYQILTTDALIICTANSFTVTLPTAIGCQGRSYKVKNVGTGTIGMGSTLSQTIDGIVPANTAIYQYDCLTFESDGANWILV